MDSRRFDGLVRAFARGDAASRRRLLRAAVSGGMLALIGGRGATAQSGWVPLGGACWETRECISYYPGDSVICLSNDFADDGPNNCVRGNDGWCASDRHCIADLVCIDNSCQDPIAPPGFGSVELGDPCTSTDQCSQFGAFAICAENGFYDDGFFNCCRGEASPCGSDRHCCGDLSCDDNGIVADGVLNCVGYFGDSCTTSAGCYGDLVCVLGSCE